MASQVDRVVSLYKKLALIPTVAGAKLAKNGTTVLSHWTEKNLETNKNSKIYFKQELDENFKVVSDSGFGVDVSNELVSVLSPLENFKAIVRELTDSSEKKCQYLEIWKYRQLQRSINLTALEIHGDVYADSEFGSFDWNKTESKLLYVAEKKLKKSEPFYKRQPIKTKDKTDDEGVTKGKEYDYKPEWGEQLVGKHLSSIIVCEIDSETCKIIEGVPENLCPGQVCWSPDESSIVGVAWETEPRRLGLIFCTNRPSVVFEITLDGKFTVISKKGKSVRSPRFSTDGKYLVWLQRNEAGPHHDCHELVKTSWPLEKEPIIETIINEVDNEITIEDGQKFTGIYSQALSKRSFALDNKRIVFSTPQRTEIRPYVVNTETGKITDITGGSKSYSVSVLDVHQDIILAYRTSFIQPHQLMVGKLPKIGEEQSINWHILDDNQIEASDIMKSAQVEIMDLSHENVNDEIKNFTALYLGNKTSTNNGLIVYPHGGPHSSFVNAFSLEAALYSILGFSMVQINYRGSTGAGKKSLSYLLGRVGDADVKDCILATDEVLKKFPVSADKCFLLGRSHGGFLVTHLSGQYPEKFRAVVAGNPVTDVASKLNATDIPDWGYVESGSAFTEFGPVNGDLLSKMHKMSPMFHAHKVKAPTLMCLGSKDKRVPYFQGMEYYNKIKANGCEARMLIYEDNHALTATRNIEIDHVINSALWFLDHMNNEAI